jgi:hypothetical protein
MPNTPPAPRRKKGTGSLSYDARGSAWRLVATKPASKHDGANRRELLLPGKPTKKDRIRAEKALDAFVEDLRRQAREEDMDSAAGVVEGASGDLPALRAVASAVLPPSSSRSRHW